MRQSHKTELYKQMIDKLEKFNPQNWKDIDNILMQVKKTTESVPEPATNSFPEDIKNGIALITSPLRLSSVAIR